MDVHALLYDVPEDTAVIGDVEGFLRYVESGQAAEDYDRLVAQYQRELDWAFRD